MNFEANATSTQQTSEVMNTTQNQQTPLSEVKVPKAYNNPLIQNLRIDKLDNKCHMEKKKKYAIANHSWTGKTDNLRPERI
ncbi:MAG: hypothetical protein KME38_30180 [Spirirestis rafaelensis WJT71-NPBG6]|jgi:hypothetical protein|nr:hypothetical protein [Spirirestis rafaelensis WJT71-NPBG6]